MTRARRLLFVTNKTGSFLSHRLPIAEAARAAGFEVGVACPADDDAERVRELGFAFHAIPLGRSSANPLRELHSVWALVRLFRRVRPDVVHLVTMKPNLYGGVAARVAGVARVVNAISGLGYMFLAKGALARLRRWLVLLAYRLAFRHPGRVVIFQNPDDRDEFRRHRLLDAKHSVLIKGVGVNTVEFAPTPEPAGPVTVVLPSRLLRDKGVVEFADAARRLRSAGTRARFVLVGDTDAGNPASLDDGEVERWVDEQILEWWGWREDMPHVLGCAHVVCLPSYREGLPKVLIEAAACGRPIVTCDVPGCREIVRHDENGLLVPARDADALAEALDRLIADRGLRERLGRAGRARVEAEFSQEHVVRETLRLYRAPAIPT